VVTDHASIKMMLTGESDFRRAIADKILRWKLRMGAYKFDIEIIRGESNIFADMLSRFRGADVGGVTLRDDEQFEDPVVCYFRIEDNSVSLEEIREASYDENIISADLILDKKLGVFITNENQIFVPEVLRRRIVSMVHSSTHRGVEATKASIESKYYWPNLKDYVESVVRGCLHCQSTGVTLVKRQLGTLIKASAPREIWAMDHWNPGAGGGKEKILTIRDVFTGFVVFERVTSETAEATAAIAAKYIGMWGAPQKIATDNGPAFQGQIFKILARTHRIKLHFSLSNISYTNALIERCHKELNRLLRSTISDNRLSVDEWSKVLGAVAGAINGSPSRRLGGRSPGAVFHGGNWNLHSQLIQVGGKSIPFSEWKQQHEGIIKELQTTMDKSLDGVVEIRNNDQLPQGEIVNYEQGDYVLIADHHKLSKLSLFWIGPFVVKSQKSEHTVEVTELDGSAAMVLHVAEVRLFKKAAYVEEDNLTYEDQRRWQTACFKLEKFIGLRNQDGKTHIKVKWWSEKYSWESWEDICLAYQAEPDKTQKFLENYPEQNVTKQAALDILKWKEEV
jgi:hypothetical protein